MKRLMIVLAVLFVFSASAYAQMGMTGGATSGEQKGEMKPCGMMMSEEQQMPMCQQMMMGQNMMMKDMMQMMMDMINMQEKLMMGAKASEKKQMMKNLTQMKEKMQKMMSVRPGMMGQASDVSRCRLACAEQLKKAIELHELHIKDLKTATEASQLEMMDQLEKAYECITGSRCGISEIPQKEPESKETEKENTSKGNAHGH